MQAESYSKVLHKPILSPVDHEVRMISFEWVSICDA
jgi:hypothetical protein